MYSAGLIWAEIKQLWDEGAHEYVHDMWNILDFVTNSLYIATLTLRVIAYLQVSVYSFYSSKTGNPSFFVNLISFFSLCICSVNVKDAGRSSKNSRKIWIDTYISSADDKKVLSIISVSILAHSRHISELETFVVISSKSVNIVKSNQVMQDLTTLSRFVR